MKTASGHETIKNRTSADVEHINVDQFSELALDTLSEWLMNGIFDELSGNSHFHVFFVVVVCRRAGQNSDLCLSGCFFVGFYHV